VTEGIEELTEKGIKTKDGKKHELDTIIYATGTLFSTSVFFIKQLPLGP
jgi:NADH dehydrogenase FAD-containing subunit